MKRDDINIPFCENEIEVNHTEIIETNKKKKG